MTDSSAHGADHGEEADDNHVLVMPFVACRSNGGEFEDRDWVSGYEMGIIEGQLSGNRKPTPENPGPPHTSDWRWINTGNVHQADLIAMKHGQRLEVGEEFEGLTAVRIVEGAGA